MRQPAYFLRLGLPKSGVEIFQHFQDLRKNHSDRGSLQLCHQKVGQQATLDLISRLTTLVSDGLQSGSHEQRASYVSAAGVGLGSPPAGILLIFWTSDPR